MRVTTIPCLADNYAYLVTCEATGASAIIDPSEALPVRDAVRAVGIAPTAIWCTHHHPDHVGGNLELVSTLGIRQVVGHKEDWGRIPGQTTQVKGGDVFRLGDLEVRAWHVPGHTRGAIAYVIYQGPKTVAAFTGDTLFLGGCGRLFEGTAASMHQSLSALASLDEETLIYPGHEYTEANLAFAHSLEPTNDALRARYDWAKGQRARGLPTVPGTMADELATNPFLRVSAPSLREGLPLEVTDDDLVAFTAVRALKDRYRVAR